MHLEYSWCILMHFEDTWCIMRTHIMSGQAYDLASDWSSSGTRHERWEVLTRQAPMNIRRTSSYISRFPDVHLIFSKFVIFAIVFRTLQHPKGPWEHPRSFQEARQNSDLTRFDENQSKDSRAWPSDPWQTAVMSLTIPITYCNSVWSLMRVLLALGIRRGVLGEASTLARPSFCGETSPPPKKKGLRPHKLMKLGNPYGWILVSKIKCSTLFCCQRSVFSNISTENMLKNRTHRRFLVWTQFEETEYKYNVLGDREHKGKLYEGQLCRPGKWTFWDLVKPDRPKTG